MNVAATGLRFAIVSLYGPHMKYFALVVFALHTVFELVFGFNAFVSGAFSWQNAAAAAAQPLQLGTSARFLGSALFALGVLGAVVIFGPGVRSATAKVVSVGLATFHTLGTVGVIIAAFADPTVLSQTNTLGAFVVHGVLAIGFILLVGMKVPAVQQTRS